MNNKIKAQQGYLLILATILIVIVAFVSLLLAYMYVGGSFSTADIVNSNSALYIGKSGLEIAERDIMVNSTACNAVNGSATYTTANLLGGQFTLTGFTNSYSNTLQSGITANATTIPLATALPATTLGNALATTTATNVTINSYTGFPTSGFISVGNELIYYNGITTTGSAPYALSNVVRGAAGTVAGTYASGAAVKGGFSPAGVVAVDNEVIPYFAVNTATPSLLNAIRRTGAVSHNAGAQVVQSECVLTSLAATPTLAAPQGERTVQQVLHQNITQGFQVDGHYPKIAAIGQVILDGGPITNLSATCPGTSTSAPGVGSTIVTGSSVIFNGGSTTVLTGSPNPCSQTYNTPPGVSNDVLTSQPITSLWSSFFGNNSVSTVINDSSNVVYNVNTGSYNDIVAQLNSASNYGKTIIVKGPQMLVNAGAGAGNITVGSPAQPVVLIINTSGGMNINASNIAFTVYGLLYFADPSGSNSSAINIGGSNDTINAYGSIAVEGTITFNSYSSMNLYPYTGSLAPANQYVVIPYVHTPFTSREIFY